MDFEDPRPFSLRKDSLERRLAQCVDTDKRGRFKFEFSTASCIGFISLDAMEKTGKPFSVESASHVAGMKKARGNALNH